MACEYCKSMKDIEDLSSPYVVRVCPQCNREIKLREYGENGHGIKVEKGDRVIMPDGAIKLSANPLKSRVRYSRDGIVWFAQNIFVESLPAKEKEYIQELSKNEEFIEKVLEQSELLKNNIEGPDQFDRIFDFLKNKQQSYEWWILLFGIYTESVKAAIKENNAEKAAWASSCAERCRSMSIFIENYQDVVWMGSSARRIIELLEIWQQNENNSSENYWQQLFKENPFIIGQIFAVPIVFIQDNVYVGGMNIERKDAKFLDYLYTSQTSNDSLLIEIKTPCTKLLGQEYRKNVFSPSSELTGAITQVLDYRKELSENIRSITNGTEHNIQVICPKCALIIGNYKEELSTEAKMKSFELFRMSIKDVDIVTYDEMFKKAEVLASIFNLIKKSN